MTARPNMECPFRFLLSPVAQQAGFPEQYDWPFSEGFSGQRHLQRVACKGSLLPQAGWHAACGGVLKNRAHALVAVCMQYESTVSHYWIVIKRQAVLSLSQDRVPILPVL